MYSVNIEGQPPISFNYFLYALIVVLENHLGDNSLPWTFEYTPQDGDVEGTFN